MEGGERREEAPVAAVPGSLCPLRVVSRTAPTDLAAGNVASMASVASMRRMVRMSIVPRFGTHHHVCHHPVLCLLRPRRRLARWIALLQQALQVFPRWVAGFQNRGQLFQDLTVLKGKVRGWKRRDTAGGIVGRPVYLCELHDRLQQGAIAPRFAAREEGQDSLCFLLSTLMGCMGPHPEKISCCLLPFGHHAEYRIPVANGCRLFKRKVCMEKSTHVRLRAFVVHARV